MALLGMDCVDCTGSSTSFSLAASVANNTADGCMGAAHVIYSAKQKVCQTGPWHGTLSISGFDCCDEVSVVLTDDGGDIIPLSSLGSASSSTNFSFTIPDCGGCGSNWYVQVISSDVDGCSQGWTGSASFTAGEAPP